MLFSQVALKAFKQFLFACVLVYCYLIFPVLLHLHIVTLLFDNFREWWYSFALLIFTMLCYRGITCRSILSLACCAQVLPLKDQVNVSLKRADKGTFVRDVLSIVNDAGTTEECRLNFVFWRALSFLEPFPFPKSFSGRRPRLLPH